MTENLLETIRATVQDFLAPEIRTHGVRLEALAHKIDETKETLVAKIEAVDRALQDTKETLSTRIEAVANSVEETKQTLRGHPHRRSPNTELGESDSPGNGPYQPQRLPPRAHSLARSACFPALEPAPAFPN